MKQQPFSPKFLVAPFPVICFQAISGLFSFQTRMQQQIEFICGPFNSDNHNDDNDSSNNGDDSNDGKGGNDSNRHVIRSASLLMELI